MPEQEQRPVTGQPRGFTDHHGAQGADPTRRHRGQERGDSPAQSREQAVRHTFALHGRPANATAARPAAEPIVTMLHLMSHPVASSAEVPGPATDGVQRIQAVDRAIVLLKAVAASTTPPTVLELARHWV